uniref:(northern house mosquito) hypothetical protein n=1 Tax=Culex pipiens TaxID=7175 RepID=A0A8D8K8W6_CULPI
MVPGRRREAQPIVVRTRVHRRRWWWGRVVLVVLLGLLLHRVAPDRGRVVPVVRVVVPVVAGTRLLLVVVMVMGVVPGGPMVITEGRVTRRDTHFGDLSSRLMATGAGAAAATPARFVWWIQFGPDVTFQRLVMHFNR